MNLFCFISILFLSNKTVKPSIWMQKGWCSAVLYRRELLMTHTRTHTLHTHTTHTHTHTHTLIYIQREIQIPLCISSYSSALLLVDLGEFMVVASLQKKSSGVQHLTINKFVSARKINLCVRYKSCGNISFKN